jgi:hypothetical protein
VPDLFPRGEQRIVRRPKPVLSEHDFDKAGGAVRVSGENYELSRVLSVAFGQAWVSKLKPTGN